MSKTLGEIAFNAYNQIRGGVTHDGKPTPPWSDLGKPIRAAWEAAALAVVYELRDEITKIDGDAGWVRTIRTAIERNSNPASQAPQAPPDVTVKLTDGCDSYMHELNARAFWERMFEGALVATLANAKYSFPDEGNTTVMSARYADLALKAWRERFKNT